MISKIMKFYKWYHWWLIFYFISHEQYCLCVYINSDKHYYTHTYTYTYTYIFFCNKYFNAYFISDNIMYVIFYQWRTMFIYIVLRSEM